VLDEPLEVEAQDAPLVVGVPADEAPVVAADEARAVAGRRDEVLLAQPRERYVSERHA
jgi:hypothetical protein